MIPPEPPPSKRPLMFWRGAWRPIPRWRIWRARIRLRGGKHWEDQI
jgi:hypothetical protein